MAITPRKADSSHQGDMDGSEHFVQFCETDISLMNAVGEFISTGLSLGDACIVIATESHRERIEERLEAVGIEVAAACAQGQYISLDATATLSQIMIAGEPSTELFFEIVGDIIMQAAQRGQRVRVFGEMVMLLWTGGGRTAAIHLEELWNELGKVCAFSLFCAYPMDGFGGTMYEEEFARICQLHSRVVPSESYTLLPGVDERLRAITLLQQKAHSLEVEIAERKAVEERLRISENRYRRLFETSNDGILMVDPGTGKIIDVNPCAMALLASTREQLLTRELWQIDLFRDQDIGREVLQKLRENSVLRYDALTLGIRDGHYRRVDFVGTLYQVDGYEVIQCNIRDITERWRAEEALHHLAAIVESSDDAILSKDLNGTITSWNAAAMRMYGYQPEEIVGRPVTVLFPPDRPDEFAHIMGRIRQGKRVDHYEAIRMRKDGTLLTVSVTVSPIKDSTGTVVGASAIARNITAQKQLDAKFRQLFNSNLIGIFVSDFAGTFLEANRAFLDLLGYTRAELEAGLMARDTITPPEFHIQSQNALRALRETGASDTYEKEYLHKSGRRIPVLIAVTRIEQTDTCIGFVLDISERKELDRRKDEFISLASHELKTPVTSLKGFLSLLQRQMAAHGSEKELHYLARMNTQVNKLGKLISDLLDISKMQAGHLVYREERFDLSALVQEIVENIQGTTQTHRLLFTAQTQVEVFGDRDRVGQVLINLLNNAVKYSPNADSVQVQLSQDQNMVIVGVRDFGIGIAAEHQHRIFERFYQVTDPEEKTYPGLGIGLYISCEIVRRHKGKLWVESQKGEGATFYFSLPLLCEDERLTSSPQDARG